MATADAINTIAESLKETDEIPRKQIAEIVSVLGSEVALELLAETRKVQDSGGIEVRDGTRRRTDGGVFFSLAKARLPRSDRNRIFRIRPPRPEGAEEHEPAAPASAAETVPRPVRVVPAVRPAVDISSVGRRRVVEVEVLRHGKPQATAPAALPIRDVAPPPPQETRPTHEDRPVRRIVVAAGVKDEPAPTLDAARERIRGTLRGFPEVERKRLLEELLGELGGAPKPEALPAAMDPKLREQVLASVTDAIGLSSADLARALYGEENPSAHSKARLALDRWRKARGT